MWEEKNLCEESMHIASFGSTVCMTYLSFHILLIRGVPEYADVQLLPSIHPPVCKRSCTLLENTCHVFFRRHASEHHPLHHGQVSSVQGTFVMQD